MSKTILITIQVLFAVSLYSQNKIYVYKPYNYVEEALNSFQKGRAQTATISENIELARNNFFKSLKSKSSDLVVREKEFYNLLFQKDMFYVFDLEMTKLRFPDGNINNQIFESIFGKIDNGIHPFIKYKFIDFANAFLSSHYSNKKKYKSSDDYKLLRECFNECKDEYESYIIARDWLEFKIKNAEEYLGLNKIKFNFIGLLNVETYVYGGYKQSEKTYNDLINYMGNEAFSKNMKEIVNELKVTQNEITLENKSLFTPGQQSILFSMLRRVGFQNAYCNIIYHQKFNSRNNLGYALHTFDNYTQCFGKEVVNSAVEELFKIKRSSNSASESHGFDLFESPVVIPDCNTRFNTPHDALFPLLASKSNIGLLKYICKFATIDEIKDYNSLEKKFGHIKMNQIAKTLYQFCAKSDYFVFDFDKASGIVANSLGYKSFDFSSPSFEDINYGGWNLERCKNYVEKNNFPQDTLTVYVKMEYEIKIDPKMWNNQKDGYHINGLSNGICKFYGNKPLPATIKTLFILNNKIRFSYTLSKDTDYKIVKYNQNMSANISGAIWSSYKACYYK